MNFTPAVSSWASATRRPVTRPTVREARLAAAETSRGRQYNRELHDARPAELTYDPGDDFAPGLRLSLQEIAYGLKLGVWTPGTIFRLKARSVVVGSDGWGYTPGGRRIVLVAAIGR